MEKRMEVTEEEIRTNLLIAEDLLNEGRIIQAAERIKYLAACLERVGLGKGLKYFL